MPTRFVSKPIAIIGSPTSDGGARMEPSLPGAFRFENEEIAIATVLRTWRSTKDDRGDLYLKRHWFEFETCDGRRCIVYFDRGACRGAPRWWLYTITTTV